MRKLLLSQNEQIIKVALKLVGVWFFLNWWGVPSYTVFILLKPTGHVMHQQFNIQQLYALPTLYLCVLYLSENKQRLVPLTS